MDDMPEVAEAIIEVAKAGNEIATQLKYLGGGDNTDHRGAIEMLGISLLEAADKIAMSISDLAQAVRERD